MNKLLLCFLSLLLVPALVFAYGTWQEETDPMDGVMAYMDRLDQAIQRAAAGRSAHPALLEELTSLAKDLRTALADLQQDSPWGEYPPITASDVSGQWAVVGNGHGGVLILDQEGMKLSGTIYGDLLAEARISLDGTIFFVRTGSNQVWTGTLDPTGTKMTGTFDCPVTGGRGYLWEAVRQ